MPDGEDRVIRILRVDGPLFVCADPSVYADFFPQARKKRFGAAHLSIEELEYLAHSFPVAFARDADAERRAVLRERHSLACRAYRHLTDAVGLRLRHGSQFGAAFIGYRNLREHGDCLVHFGPLSPVAVAAAARAARGVGKVAWVVEELPAGGFAVAPAECVPRKCQRGESRT